MLSLPRLAALLALALALPARAAPIAQMEPAQLDEQLARFSRFPIGARIDAVSKLFLGTPYGDFPLGEGGSGPEPQARWRLDTVDCQTFVETVLALVNSRSTAQAQRVLDDVRYGKEPISFATRSHFTEAQWLPANLEKGYLREAVQSIDGRAPSAELILHKAQWGRIEALKRLADADVPEGKFPIRYLPLADFKKRAKSIETGTVILVVRAFDPKRIVRVSHMGFLLQDSRGLLVRHAAAGSPRAVIDEPIDAYLKRMSAFKTWPVVGFGLAMPLDAKVRAAQFEKQ